MYDCHDPLMDGEVELAMQEKEGEVVKAVLAGIEWNWKNADRFGLWDFLRNVLHGAGLAMIGAGLAEAEDDFHMLRDIAATRNQMKNEENEQA